MVNRSEGWAAAESIEVAAPPGRVWAIVSDLEGHTTLAGSGEVLAIRLTGPVEVGATFESDVRTGEVGSFTPRGVIDDVTEPERFAWTSLPPLDEGETEDHQIEVRWAFELSSTAAGGTLVRHTLHIPAPKAGAEDLGAFFDRTDRITTVRRGMSQTLQNLRTVAEQS